MKWKHPIIIYWKIQFSLENDRVSNYPETWKSWNLEEWIPSDTPASNGSSSNYKTLLKLFDIVSLIIVNYLLLWVDSEEFSFFQPLFLCTTQYSGVITRHLNGIINWLLNFENVCALKYHVAKFKEPCSSSPLVQFINIIIFYIPTLIILLDDNGESALVKSSALEIVPLSSRLPECLAEKHYISLRSSLFIIVKQIKYLLFSYYFEMAQVLNREEET